MIKVDMATLLVGYTSLMLLLLIFFWVRIFITFRKGWKSSEDQIIQCRECSYKFIVDALSESEKCPNCQTECQVRWNTPKEEQDKK